jgi:hypothetical protein
VFSVQFNGPLRKGDSGTWVLDAVSHGLYGHIVAGCEETMTAYVVPAKAVFEDAMKFLGFEISLDEASSSSIKTSEDIIQHDTFDYQGTKLQDMKAMLMRAIEDMNAGQLALQDNVRALEEANRKLQEDLLREKEEKDQIIQRLVKISTTNLVQLKHYFDEKSEQLRINMEDKIEQNEDKAEGAYAAVEDLQIKYQDMEEMLMRTIEDVDAGRRPSLSLTPLLHSESWAVRIVLVPSRNAPFAFGPDTLAYRRCQTRSLHQDIHFKDKSSQTFTSRVEATFTSILRSRLWMPLQCINSTELSLQHLDAIYLKPSSWDYGLLEAQCLAHNKSYGGDGNVIFIALKDEDLSWEDIKNLPTVFGSDESCWKHDEELDSPSSKESMDYRLGNDRIAANSDSTYGDYNNSPPPYVPRETPCQGPVNSRRPLDILADLSAQLPTIGAPSILTAHSDYSDSELHRDKRPQRYIPLPRVHSMPGSPHSQQPSTRVIRSGRTKRKIADSKLREVMDWRPSEISLKFLSKRPSIGQQSQQSQPQFPPMPQPPSSP